VSAHAAKRNKKSNSSATGHSVILGRVIFLVFLPRPPNPEGQMAESHSTPRSDADRPALVHCEKLRKLARWYREFAERAGNPDVWAARLRTAEDLEAEAAQVETKFAEAASAGLAAQ
jgi:hypothetical protein